MTITKKHFIYGAIALIIVASLAIAGALLMRTIAQIGNTSETSSGTSSNTEPQSITEDEATKAIASAKEARNARKYDDAIALYQKARSFYETSDKADQIADIDAALSLLGVEKKNAPTIIKAPIAGQE